MTAYTDSYGKSYEVNEDAERYIKRMRIIADLAVALKQKALLKLDNAISQGVSDIDPIFAEACEDTLRHWTEAL